jgi:uncharacterized protein (DUF849 family)
MSKVVTTAAVIGGVTSRDDTPHAPITPAEIAASAVECCRAGAAICHLHVRDPETGRSSTRLDLYREVVGRVRGECDALISLTTTPGSRLMHRPRRKTWDTASLLDVEARFAHVAELQPELCSIHLGSINLRLAAYVNTFPMVERLVHLAREAGVKPELLAFDAGHVRVARHLVERGLIAPPPWIQLCLGIPWAIEFSEEALLFLRRQLPPGTVWGAFAGAADQLPMVRLALQHGGHVRVGFEDNVRLSRHELAPSNAALVRQAVAIAAQQGREPATPAEARALLGLAPRQ